MDALLYKIRIRHTSYPVQETKKTHPPSDDYETRAGEYTLFAAPIVVDYTCPFGSAMAWSDNLASRRKF